MTLKNISANMQIILDFDIPTLIECFKASGIIINPDQKIVRWFDSSNIYRITTDIVIYDTNISVVDINMLIDYNKHAISCDMLLANFRTEKLKQLNINGTISLSSFIT